jgi:hypothetical protein
MISTPDMYKEIKIMDEVIANEKDDYKKAMLKSNVIIMKLLANIRTNQTKIMEKLGAEKVKARPNASEQK